MRASALRDGAEGDERLARSFARRRSRRLLLRVRTAVFFFRPVLAMMVDFVLGEIVGTDGFVRLSRRRWPLESDPPDLSRVGDSSMGSWGRMLMKWFIPSEFASERCDGKGAWWVRHARNIAVANGAIRVCRFSVLASEACSIVSR